MIKNDQTISKLDKKKIKSFENFSFAFNSKMVEIF